MPEFLIITNEISKFCKKDVDQGKIPFDIYKICSCIRETFCLSYSIRKDNNLYIYIEKFHNVIKFEGNTLRYLGPDERSQALLLSKALSFSFQMQIENVGSWKKSTPGIFIQKLSNTHNLIHFIHSLKKEHIILFHNSNDLNSNFLEIKRNALLKFRNSLLLFPLNYDSIQNHEILQQLSDSDHIISYKLPFIKEIENKILYINFQIDRLEIMNNIH